MNRDQKLSPKYWVVHDKQNDDIFPKTLYKNKQDSEEAFLDYYSFEIVGVLSDYDLEVWFYNQDRYVCELIEINLLVKEKTK